MTDQPIVAQLPLWPASLGPSKKAAKTGLPEACRRWPDRLPACVTDSPPVMRYLDLLRSLHWDQFPERNLQRNWGKLAVPYAALAAAEIIKLNEGLSSMGRLRNYLLEHPGFIWLLGFPLVPAPNHPLGFNAQASLPTERHLTYLLRHVPSAVLQFLFADSVQLILAELATRHLLPIDCISLDTKHIIAWVKENNRKAYVRERFKKDQQPKGDPDCRLGCKRRHNQTTPAHDAVPARTVRVGEYYWGYGSGIVVTKIPGLGEFVLAELTQAFDQGDATYFFPLMQQTEQRLGYKPRRGTFDAAFDAWYVHAYFYRENDPSAFAAVPFSKKGGYQANGRQFAADGLPLCAAGLPMPLRLAFTDRTSCIIEHERGQYACPLLFPNPTGQRCPIRHKNWKRGGCTAMMPTSIGARLRYTLDRESEAYQEAYRQRTAAERINSQAVALGIERPHLRNGPAIANQNTLIYTQINLRFLLRLRQG